MKPAVTADLGLRLDRGSTQPLHEQLFQQLGTRIADGTLPVGYRLPPSRSLAELTGVNRNTVVRAYAELESAGFVASSTGRGTFVAAPAPEQPAPAAPLSESGLPWQALLSQALSASPDSFLQRKAVPSGRDLINLARLQPEPALIPDELLRRCMDHVLRRYGAAALGYAPPEGLPRLRELIRDHLAHHGVPARVEDILVTSGSQQGIDLVARALINPGDPFLVDSATYTGAIKLLTVAGAQLIAVPSDEQGPDLAALARLGRAGTKGYYLIPRSHNPTSSCISAERRFELVAWSQRSAIPLIEDDYAIDLQLGAAPPCTPALRALDADVIHIGSFSKCLAPGLRIGFVLCPPALQPMLVQLKHAFDLGTSPFLQQVLAEFLERGYLRAHLGRTLPEYRVRRDALCSALQQHLPAGFPFTKPPHGVVLWLPLPARLSPNACYEEALRRGVVVSPSSLFAVDSQQVRGLRLAYCAERPERLVEGARRLAEALRAVLRRAVPDATSSGDLLGSV